MHARSRSDSDRVQNHAPQRRQPIALVPAAVGAMIFAILLLSAGAAAGACSPLTTEPLVLRVTAQIINETGHPIAGAVVITDRGGQGISSAAGRVVFDVDTAVGPLTMQDDDAEAPGIGITAIATLDGRNHVGRRHMSIDHAADAARLAERRIDASAATRNSNRSARSDRDMRPHLPASAVKVVEAGTITLRAGSDCEPQWLPTFGAIPGFAGMNGAAKALAVFDDGSGGGPALYVGGDFILADDLTPAMRIARWDGANWEAVGGGMTAPLDSTVNALIVHDDGSGPALFVGGSFTRAGEGEVNNIAKWNGIEWLPLGDGVSGGAVRSMVIFDDGTDPALYVAGEFTIAGDQPANRIAKWDGVQWSPLGDGTTNTIFAMTVFDDGSADGEALYVAGSFFQAGGAAARRIAKWNGEFWSPLGSGMLDREVFALIVFDDGNGPALYAGGRFRTAGEVQVNRVARWDGTEWSALGDEVTIEPWQHLSPAVNTLAVFDDGSAAGPSLFVGGTFSAIGGVEANRIAAWNGEEWRSLEGGLPLGPLTFLVSEDLDSGKPLLYVGQMTRGNLEEPLPRIATWNGASWSGPPVAAGEFALNTQVSALAVYDDGSGPALYAAGVFTRAGNELELNFVGRWDGTEWRSVGGGTNSFIGALAVFDDGSGPALYAGGWFTIAGGIEANRVARWDGTEWSALGSGVNSPVRALAVVDVGDGPALYAGGHFTLAGEEPANRIAKWDGVSWEPLGVGTSGAVAVIGEFDDGLGNGPALYAGGWFAQAGGIPVGSIAKWDGEAWSSLGGTWGPVYALHLFDDGLGDGPALYVGGRFQTAGGVDGTSGIARWNGVEWSSVGGGLRPFHEAEVRAMAVYDDGTSNGPNLYVCGWFYELSDDGLILFQIARWDGFQWSGIGPWVSNFYSLLTLEVYDDGHGDGQALYLGGNFPVSPAGDAFLARWGGCAPSDPQPIPGDVNRDGIVNGADLTQVIIGWATNDPSLGDANGDGIVNVQDLLLVISNWGATG